MKKTNRQILGEKSLILHKKNRGKIAISSKVKVKDMSDLSLVYTPGVGAVSSFLAKNKDKVREYTIKGNTVAVISDGSAVLGLGNIGPEGALPVMEGKCLIFKEFANIDAFPIVLSTQNTEEIVTTIKALSATFGGINIEDISAPRCFEIEDRLKKELDIPVMHDDQHGTAIIILAGLINALKVVKKEIGKVKIVLSGAGAAGTAVTKLLIKAGVKNMIVVDSMGTIYIGRKDLNKEKKEISKITNNKINGSLKEVLIGADVFIGVSAPNLVNRDMVNTMSKDAVVFALANPTPEIMPSEALLGGAVVVATGRSDFPNQLNNAQVFPGIFRGLLDYNISSVTDDIKLRVAYAIAKLVSKPNAVNIVPGIFDKRLVNTVSKAVRG